MIPSKSAAPGKKCGSWQHMEYIGTHLFWILPIPQIQTAHANSDFLLSGNSRWLQHLVPQYCGHLITFVRFYLTTHVSNSVWPLKMWTAVFSNWRYAMLKRCASWKKEFWFLVQRCGSWRQFFNIVYSSIIRFRGQLFSDTYCYLETTEKLDLLKR